MESSFDNFDRLFRKCGLRLSPPQLDQFWRFHQAFRKGAGERDLTRIRGFEDTVIKHYVDCALVPGLITLVSPVLDIGTGAGFPGIPIKIMRPELQMILAEGRAYRVAFLEEVCGRLGLGEIRIYPHKVASTFSESVKTVITRALESISETLGRVGGFLPEGGEVIFMKGPSCDEEIEAAIRQFPLEFTLADDIPYVIPNTRYRRRLVLFKRTDELMAFRGKRAGKGKGLEVTPVAHRMVKEITSEANPVFKTFLKVLSGRGIKRHRMALLSGPKQTGEVIRDFPHRCVGWLTSTLAMGIPPDIPSHMTVYRLHPTLFRRIDMFGTKDPILLIQADPLPLWRDENWPEGCTLFVPCQDPANVGAVIRSAVAFGVSRVVILKEAASPFHPRSIRAAGSALFRIPLLEGPSIRDLASTEAMIIGLSPEGKDASEFRFPDRIGLVPGLEGQGLPEGLREGNLLSIPMAEQVESLNTAVATGIALYLWKRQADK